MRTASIVKIVAWGIVVILLLGVLLMGLRGNLPWFGLDFGSYTYSNSDKYAAAEGVIDVDHISSMDIDWISGTINISEYDGNTINFHETSNKNLSENEKMHYYVSDDGKLHIKYTAAVRRIGLGMSVTKNLEIQIPKGLEMKKFSLDTVSAACEINEVNATSIKVDTVSGPLNFSNIKCDTLDIEGVSARVQGNNVTASTCKVETVSGDIILAGDIKSTEGESVSGGYEISPGVDVESMDIDTVSGGITVKLPENDGFTAILDSVSGRINSEFEMKSSKKAAAYKNGGALFEFETVSGSVDLVKLFE